MSKKNLGRVKRYNHSFYSTRGYWLRRLLPLAAGAALVFVIGFFVAPAVLDWGTRTWYEDVKGRDYSQDDAAASQAAADAQATAAPEATPAPTAEPAATTPPVDTVVDGSWAAVSLSSLGSADAIRQTAADLKAQGVAYAMIPLKDSSGYVNYASAVANASQSISASTIDAQAVARELTAQGIIPVAWIYAFQDPISCYTDRSMAIHLRDSDYLWLDAASAEVGGKPWLNPYSDTACAYIADLMQEAVDMGYKQILLSAVQFPRYVSAKQDFGTTGDVSRADRLAAVVSGWEQRFAGTALLWYEVPSASCAGGDTAYGEATPDALGMQNVMLQVSYTTAEEGAEAAAQPDSDAAAQTLLDAGCEHVVIREGSSAQLYTAP